MKNLFWRIFLSFWAVMILTLAISLYSGSRVADSGDELFSEVPPLLGEFRREAEAILASGGTTELGAWLEGASFLPRDGTMYILDETGTDILGREPPGFILQRFRSTPIGPQKASLTGPGGIPYFVLPGPVAPSAFGIFGESSTWWVIFSSAMMFSALACFQLARSFTRKLHGIADAAAAWSEGHLDARTNVTDVDEIGVVAQQLDQMAGRLEKTIESRQEFFRNVSHAMRSPLARIQVALELVERDPENTHDYVGRIETETRHLEQMMEQVLGLVKLEASESAHALQPIDLVEVVDLVVSDARFECAAIGNGIQWSPPDAAYVVMGSNELVFSAVENVVRNAIRYTPPGKDMLVSLLRRNDEAELLVRDGGPGVAEDELTRIFEPFYRGIGETSPGSGIGLAISRQTITAMNGTIEAHNDASGGLSVTITLPMVATAPNENTPWLQHPEEALA